MNRRDEILLGNHLMSHTDDTVGSRLGDIKDSMNEYSEYVLKEYTQWLLDKVFTHIITDRPGRECQKLIEAFKSETK